MKEVLSFVNNSCQYKQATHKFLKAVLFANMVVRGVTIQSLWFAVAAAWQSIAVKSVKRMIMQKIRKSVRNCKKMWSFRQVRQLMMIGEGRGGLMKMLSKTGCVIED